MFRQGKHRDKIKSSTVDSEPEIMKPLCSEVIKLKEGKMENQSAYVKPFKGPVPQKKVLMFRVRRVANPFEIILEVVMDIKDIDYHEWFPKMQEHYTEFEDNMRMVWLFTFLFISIHLIFVWFFKVLVFFTFFLLF